MAKAYVLKKNPDMATRVIDDETILLPIYKRSDEINCIYTLNGCGSAVWKLIDGVKTVEQIKKKILSKFGSTSREIDIEMAKFIKDLKKIRAVV